MIAAWFADGSVMFAILAGIAFEAAALALLFRRTGHGLPPRVLLPNLAAGGCLLAASGLALRGIWWGWVGALLLTGGLLHVIDLRRRWQ